MNAAALDTNMFLYAHIADYEIHAKVRHWLSEFLDNCECFYISWQIFYEYIRIATHPKLHEKPLTVLQALDDLRPYLSDSRCKILKETSAHQQVFQELVTVVPFAKGNFIHDCHFAALLKEHAVKTIVTLDSDFLKFKFLNVISPI